MNAPLPPNVLPHEDESPLRSQLCTVPANSYLYPAGERSTELYRIRSGIVGLESVNERGERCIFHLVGSGAVLGHETLLRQPRIFDARACTDVFLEAISLLPSTDPTLSHSMMLWAHSAVTRLLQDVTRFKVELHRAQATEKVLLLFERIKNLLPEHSDTCWLPSRTEMADILDINHVTASRVVARLFREGALRRSVRKQFAQVDWNLICSKRNCL